MKAVYINDHGGSEVLKTELPSSLSKPLMSHQVRVKIHFAALNHLDIWMRRGMPGFEITPPHVMGSEASGEVLEVGDSVSDFKAGDPVIIYPALSCGRCGECQSGNDMYCSHYQIYGEHMSGLQCEEVVVEAGSLFKKPETLSYEEAAAFPLSTLTAWHMVYERAQVRQGELVLIHAIGSGVSSMAMQMALNCSAQVIVTSSSDEKLEWAKQNGAHEVVNYVQDPDWSRTIRKQYGPPHVILDHVGQTTWESNIKLLRKAGRLVVCGATTGHAAITDLRHVFFRQLALMGSTMGKKSDFSQIVDAMSRKELRVEVDKIWFVDQVRQAHQHLETRQARGKSLIQFSV